MISDGLGASVRIQDLHQYNETNTEILVSFKPSFSLTSLTLPVDMPALNFSQFLQTLWDLFQDMGHLGKI